MKTEFPSSPVAATAMKSRYLATLMVLVVPAAVLAEIPVAPPLLEITPGYQVRLSWPATAGQRYRVERSTTLGSSDVGAWTQLALVEATGAECVWLDPEPTSQKAFYRLTLPQSEVFSISPPLLSPTGGELLVRGQSIPAGSFLVLQVDGTPPSSLSIPLENLGGGVWRVSVAHPFVPGGSVISAQIEDASGTTLVTLNLPLTVTPTGRALDSPPSLPPAPPEPQLQSNPVPGIGIIVKKNPGSNHNTRVAALSPDEDCDDGDPFSPLGMAINEKGLPGDKKPRPWGPTNPKPQRTASGGGDDGSAGFDSPLPLGVAIKTKGTGAEANFAGDAMPAQDARLTGNKHPDLMKREMGPAAITPASSGLPGEVSFQTCDLSCACPAGPALAWVRTYRSMKPLNSGHGPGWDFSYHIWIEALPSSAGASATRVVIHDGGGRADTFQRQADTGGPPGGARSGRKLAMVHGRPGDGGLVLLDPPLEESCPQGSFARMGQ